MLIQDNRDQKETNFTLRRNSKQIPNLDDLSQMLHVRGRLQDMGTTSSPEGEMLTYGNPPLNAELEQMLRLGSMYDEQWNMFFRGGNTADMAGNELWPDLKVLKKMLQNEGVSFDDTQKRLDYGTSHPKLIRLSDQYDVRYEEWLEKNILNIHPAFRPGFVLEEVPQSPINLGWKFLLDDDAEDELVRRKNRRSNRLTVVVEEQPNLHNGPGPIVQETYPSPPVTPEASTRARDVTSIPASGSFASRHSRELSSGSPALLRDSRSLQAAETAMLLRDAESETQIMSIVSGTNEVDQCTETRRYEHAGALAMLMEDERQRAEERQQLVDMPAIREEKKRFKKSKRVRKWLWAVLGWRKDAERRW